MPFFKSLPDDAGPANVFGTYTDIYGPWSKMGQAIMNGPSPFSPGERELIAAFVVGTANCRFAYTAHSAAETKSSLFFLRGITAAFIGERWGFRERTVLSFPSSNSWTS